MLSLLKGIFTKERILKILMPFILLAIGAALGMKAEDIQKIVSETQVQQESK